MKSNRFVISPLSLPVIIAVFLLFDDEEVKDEEELKIALPCVHTK